MSPRERAAEWCRWHRLSQGGNVWTSTESGRHFWGRSFPHVCRRQRADDHRRGLGRAPVDTLTPWSIPP